MKSQLFDRAYSIAARAGRTALNTLMPPQCPISGAEMPAPGVLGPAGWAALQYIDEPYCRRCGVPFAADYGNEVECPACIAAAPDFDAARAAVVYDDASHRLIVGFKHSDRTDLAPMFAKWMTHAGRKMITPAAVLAPVPLHRRRLAARRYNQSALLASAIAAETGARLALHTLLRVRATPPQKDLSSDARRRNVAGAFRVRNQLAGTLKDAHIVLIDDVLTTGATLSAAARILKKAGAARVDALVLARVVKGGIGAI